MRTITEHPVLNYEHGPIVEFTFEGTTLQGYEGEPIAAALHANGVRKLRVHRGRPKRHPERSSMCRAAQGWNGS